MFKRVIKIILICLAIFLIILGVIWLIGRHKAATNKSTPLSFQQFLGLGTRQAPASNLTGEGSSQFTNPDGSNTGTNGSGTGTGTVGFGVPTPGVSQFTNGGISPTGNGANGSGNGSGNASGTGNNGGTNGSGNGSGNASGTGVGTGSNGSGGNSTGSNGGTTAAPQCSTEDTTITFTPEEIAELNQLQNQFYTLAQTLHTDADVNTELANHDAFEIKAEQAAELYNYCEAQLPAITDPNLQQHVATPFWDAWTTATATAPANQWNTSSRTDHDDYNFLVFDPTTAARLTQAHYNITDNPDTSGIEGPYGWLSFSNPAAVPIDGSIIKPGGDYSILVPVVERILHISLW